MPKVPDFNHVCDSADGGACLEQPEHVSEYANGGRNLQNGEKVSETTVPAIPEVRQEYGR